MNVKRIVANVNASATNIKTIANSRANMKISAAKRFYEKALGLECLMDLGWIATYGSTRMAAVQISFATEGGSGTPVPDLSIEVDDVHEAYRRMKKARFKIEYPLTDEPWGVCRFYVRDPFGKLINILAHV